MQNLSITTRMVQSAGYAFTASLLAVAVLVATFFLAEPVVSHGQAADTSEFVIQQTIVDESSFLVEPADVAMDGTINGISGGTANGSTTFSVQSNNNAGYYVEIAFEDNTTANAMLGAETASEALRDFDDSANGGEPVYTFTASTAAQFGYTVESLSPTDTDPSFLSDGGDLCDNGGTDQDLDSCWKGPSVSGFRIVDRDSSAPTGATSTIKFRVVVPSNPSPVPSAEPYYATATLSLFAK